MRKNREGPILLIIFFLYVCDVAAPTGPTVIKVRFPRCETDKQCSPTAACKLVCRKTCSSVCIPLRKIKRNPQKSLRQSAEFEEPFAANGNPFAAPPPARGEHRDEGVTPTPLTISESELEAELKKSGGAGKSIPEPPPKFSFAPPPGFSSEQNEPGDTTPWAFAPGELAGGSEEPGGQVSPPAFSPEPPGFTSATTPPYNERERYWLSTTPGSSLSSSSSSSRGKSEEQLHPPSSSRESREKEPKEGTKTKKKNHLSATTPSSSSDSPEFSSNTPSSGGDFNSASKEDEEQEEEEEDSTEAKSTTPRGKNGGSKGNIHKPKKTKKEKSKSGKTKKPKHAKLQSTKRPVDGCPAPEICAKNCGIVIDEEGCQGCQCLWTSNQCATDLDCSGTGLFCDLGRCECKSGFEHDKEPGVCRKNSNSGRDPGRRFSGRDKPSQSGIRLSNSAGGGGVISGRAGKELPVARRLRRISHIHQNRVVRVRRSPPPVSSLLDGGDKPLREERLQWPGPCETDEDCPPNLYCIQFDCWTIPEKPLLHPPPARHLPHPGFDEMEDADRANNKRRLLRRRFHQARTHYTSGRRSSSTSKAQRILPSPSEEREEEVGSGLDSDSSGAQSNDSPLGVLSPPPRGDVLFPSIGDDRIHNGRSEDAKPPSLEPPHPSSISSRTLITKSTTPSIPTPPPLQVEEEGEEVEEDAVPSSKGIFSSDWDKVEDEEKEEESELLSSSIYKPSSTTPTVPLITTTSTLPLLPTTPSTPTIIDSQIDPSPSPTSSKFEEGVDLPELPTTTPINTTPSSSQESIKRKGAYKEKEETDEVEPKPKEKGVGEWHEMVPPNSKNATTSTLPTTTTTEDNKERKIFYDYSKENRVHKPVRVEMTNAKEIMQDECSRHRDCGDKYLCCKKRWWTAS